MAFLVLEVHPSFADRSIKLTLHCAFGFSCRNIASGVVWMGVFYPSSVHILSSAVAPPLFFSFSTFLTAATSLVFDCIYKNGYLFIIIVFISKYTALSGLLHIGMQADIRRSR